MSEIKINKIKSSRGPITIAGITTFSGTKCVTFPVGTVPTRSVTPEIGETRYINGDVVQTIEYYNGKTWVTIGVV